MKATNEGNSQSWKKVTLGGVAGILLGSAGTLYAQQAQAENAEETDEPEENNATTDLPDHPHVSVNGLPLAESVSEDMSFSEAFAAARQEVGAGGVFEWHGGIYGTYYAEEWDNMSAQERNEFGSHISYGVHAETNTAQHPTDTTPDASETPVEAEPDVIEAEYTPDDEEVQVLGVTETDLNGQQVTVGVLGVGEERMAVIDVDQDGTFDIAVSDMNHNGEIEDNEMKDISDLGYTVDKLLSEQNQQQDFSADPASYTPDDVSDMSGEGTLM